MEQKKQELFLKYPTCKDLITELYDAVEKGVLPLTSTMLPQDYPVFGRGNINSDVMIIAEAPGLNEAECGDPLVGKSGELVEILMNEFNIDTNKNIFVTNVVRLFPYNVGKKGTRHPRAPTTSEVREHAPYLKRLIKRVNPKIIFTFGKIASNALCSHLEIDRWGNLEPNDLPLISDLQKQIRPAFIEGMERGVYVVPLWHPSYILRLSSNRKEQYRRKATWKYRVKSGWDLYRDINNRPPLQPKPMMLTDQKAGLNRKKYPDFEWTTYKNTTFYTRPELPSYHEIINNDIDFQFLTAKYLKKQNKFRAFGRDRNGRSIACTIEGFPFHFYIDIPNIHKNKPTTPLLLKLLYSDITDSLPEFIVEDEAFSMNLSFVNKLPHNEYHNVFEDEPTFVKIELTKHSHVRTVLEAVKKQYNNKNYNIGHYETDVQPEDRFTYDKSIKASYWVHINSSDFVLDAARNFNEDSMVTNSDIEIKCNYKDIKPVNDCSDVAPQIILGFDIECENKNGKFPRADRDAVITICADVQFQRSDTHTDPKSGVCKENLKYVFQMRKCASFNSNVNLYQFNDERELLACWRKFIIELNPDKICGHNIKRFDWPYIVDRATFLKLTENDGWGTLSMIKDDQPYVTHKKFQSKAYGERIIIDVPLEGRANLDTMEIYLRKEKYASYTLEFISQKKLGDRKNDMPYVAIPGYFWGDQKAVKKLAEYCLKDAELPVRLLNKDKILFELCEYARVTGSVFEDGIYTRGQQIKVFSSIMHTNNELNLGFIFKTEDRQQQTEFVIEDWMIEGNQNKDDVDEMDELEQQMEEYKQLQKEIQETEQAQQDKPKKKTGQTDLISFFATTKSAAKAKAKVEQYKKKEEDKKRTVKYQGASVLTPKVGFVEVPVVTLDFAALYPSIMIDNNLSPDGRVWQCQLKEKGFGPASLGDNYDPSKDLFCSPIKFVHKGCDKCGTTPVHVYFVKQEYKLTVYESDIQRRGIKMNELEDTGKMELHPWKWRQHTFHTQEEREAKYEKVYMFKDKTKGMSLLPLTLTRLLAARKAAKRVMFSYPSDHPNFHIYNGRQLGLKITCNSVYGATGVSVGKIADPTVSATVTAVGRLSIEGTRDRAMKHFSEGVWLDLLLEYEERRGHYRGNDCVGGDTDSWFATYGFVDTLEEAMEFGPRSSVYQNKFFRKPMSIDFEKAEWPKIIVAKKRYASNLFSDEYNFAVFPKKRWIEFYRPQEQWQSIFKTKKYYIDDQECTETEWTQAKASDTQNRKFTSKPWYYDDVIYSKKEWKDMLEKEENRRAEQTDEEWIQDYKRPRFTDNNVFNPSEYGKFFNRGLETVRRSSCMFLRETMKTYLEIFLKEGRIYDAIMYVYYRVRALINGKIPKEQLLLSRQISKEHYDNATQPHIYLAKKMKERGDEPPELGNRCPFFILKEQYKGQKTYERAEHPDKVYEHNLDIDYQYYITNQVKIPLLKIIEPVMDNAEDILFNINYLYDNRVIKNNIRVSFGNENKITNFLQNKIICQFCGSQFPETENKSLVCNACLQSNPIQVANLLYSKNKKKKMKVDKKYNKQMDICIKCTNTEKAPCNNYTCDQYSNRRTLEREVGECSKTIGDIEDIANNLSIKLDNLTVNSNKRKKNINIRSKKRKLNVK